MGVSYIDAVDACYEVLDAGGSLENVTRLLGDLVGADAGDIVAEDEATGEVFTFGSFGFDPVYRDLYDEAYLGANPWATALEEGPVNRLNTRIEERKDYISSAYFNEWVRPQKLERSVGARLSAVPGRRVWIGFVRETGGSAFGDVSALERVLPHLNRAISIAGQISPEAKSLETLDEAALCVGADGRIREANVAAERLLDGTRLRQGRDGRLMLSNRADQARFDAALAATIGGVLEPNQAEPGAGRICLAHDVDGGVTALKLLPHTRAEGNLGSLRRGALVRLADWSAPERSPDLRPLALEFGLTGTEAELVGHLARGGGLDSFAESRGIALSTVRWHLKNAESKTGTRRVEQLVALAFRRGFRA